MSPEDAEIIRTIRRELSKRPIDPMRADIQVVGGRVTIAGIIGNLREQPDVDLKYEMEMLQKQLSRDRMIREISIQCRLLQTENEGEEDGNTRGRTRGGH